jgi:sugar phosphate isomerase/epimerase
MTPTLFSVSYAGLWGQASLSLEDFIRKAGQLGYSAVELMGKGPHLSVLELSEDRLASVRAAADEAGVEIATIAAYTDFTAGKTAAEVPFIEMQLMYVGALTRAAKRLGAKIVRVFTGYTTDTEQAGPDWAKCVRAIRICAAAAAEQGIILGVQNHHDVGVSTEAFHEFLLDVDHPNCKAMFDPWTPALHVDDLYEAAKFMAPLMVQTTLADYVHLRRYAYMPGLVTYRDLPGMVRAVPLGDGFIDLEAFFTGLREGGFNGYVAYEMCSPLRGGGTLENLDQTATKSLNKIRELTT